MEHAKSLVTRKEIQDTLWQGETFVDFEQGLNYCIRQIRIALEDSVDEPRFIATVPRRGYRFVAEVQPAPEANRPVPSPQEPLNRQTAEPLQSIANAEADADAIPPSPNVQSAEPWHWRPRTRISFAILFGALVLGGLAYYAGTRARIFPAFSSTGDHLPNGRSSIAFFNLENATGDEQDAWLATALSELLATELSQDNKIRVISGEDIAGVRAQIPASTVLSAEAAQRTRLLLGADLLAIGSYSVSRQDGGIRAIRLQLNVQDARTGQIVAVTIQNGDEGQLLELVSRTSSVLREKLGIGQPTLHQEIAFDHSFPSGTETRRLYAEGLQKERHFDALGARDLLEQVVQTEPQFAPGHAALAGVWSTLGYKLKAVEEAKKAVDLDTGLSHEDQLSLKARYYEMSQEPVRAAETLSTLTSLFPDELDYGLRLATVQSQAGRTGGALATLARLRRLPQPTRDSPELDITEAEIQNRLGNFKTAVEVSDSAVRKSRLAGAHILVSQALRSKAVALQRLGSADAALAAASEARQVAIDVGFPRGVALSLVVWGTVLQQEGKFEAARERLENALSIFQELGDKDDEGQALENIGSTLVDQGKFAQAQNVYARAVEIYKDIQYSQGIASATGDLATTLEAMGDLRGAVQMHQDALQVLEQTGDKRRIATEIDNIAFIQEELGNLAAAAEGHRKCVAMDQEMGYQRGEMYARSGLGDVLLMQGDFAGARQEYQAARDLAEHSKSDDHVALYDLDLATVDFAQERLAEAEARLRRSAAQFQASQDPEGNAETYALLTRVLIGEKKLAAATEAAQKATTYLEQTTSQPPRFEVDLALSALDAATGKADSGRKRLLKLLQETRAAGYAQYIFEARRELIGLDSAKSRATQFAALAGEARQKGFGLIEKEIESMPIYRASVSEASVRAF